MNPTGFPVTEAHSSSKRWNSNLVPILGAFLTIALNATPLSAATPTYADPSGFCNGSSPCFSTLQGAVDHAGPAPAEVFLFPGVYAESVDLSTMGSAVGESLGDLTLQAVDASGAPTGYRSSTSCIQR